MSQPSIGWSEFALRRHVRGGSHAYFAGSPAELLALVRENWHRRRPGTGRQDLDKAVVVPIPPERCVSGTVRLKEDTPLHVRFARRQPHEDGYARVTAEGAREPALYAAVVLYSATALQENAGTRSGDWDWEVVSLLAGPRADAPMEPLSMARNMLAKSGGTPSEFTALQFAEAVYYWSQRAAAHPDTG